MKKKEEQSVEEEEVNLKEVQKEKENIERNVALTVLPATVYQHIVGSDFHNDERKVKNPACTTKISVLYRFEIINYILFQPLLSWTTVYLFGTIKDFLFAC